MAEELASAIEAPHCILLNGSLGSGKTTFAQFFINCLDKNIVVTSPTFNIINIYDTIKGSVLHADLYRLSNENELEVLGILEFIRNGITIIEWPDIIKPFLVNIKLTEINL